MHYFPLQAASVDYVMTAFNIEDCPKLVDDEFFYLANRPGTDLLRKDTIFRGSDVFTSESKRIFEGDILRTTGEDAIYIVQFYNGFKLRGKDESMRPLTCEFMHLGSWLNLRDEVCMPQWLAGTMFTPMSR